jgi:DNA-binding NtrC family response regulator
LLELEREAIEAALERARGVVSRAAAELGLSRQALYRRMERLGIELERRIR